MHKDLDEVLISAAQLDEGIKKLGRQISEDYAGRSLTLVGVLKGCVFFMTDLARALTIDARLDFMMLSSYSGAKSSGVVRILKDLDTDVMDRDVLIIEDIIDSGLTLSWLKSNLESRGAKSVRIATMLRKPEAAKVDIDVDFLGFDIPNEFVVGYGLDYAENYRHLPFIGTLAPHVYRG